MKTTTTIFTIMFLLSRIIALAQISENEDDIYYTPIDDIINSTNNDNSPASDDEYKTIYDANRESAPANKTTEEYADTNGDTYVTNNYYYEEEEFDYDDYYDYSYSSRLRRFHNPVSSYGYYDPYYTNSYWYSYNPYDYGSSIYLGYPWWGTTISWGWGLGSLIFGWGYPNYYSNYGYHHHHHWNHHYNHHYAGHYGYGGYGYGGYGYGGYGYGGYGYGGYGYGYGNSYWAGYNDGYADGAYDYSGYYGGATGHYYNSYDGNSNYYGPRIVTATNLELPSVSPKGIADIYQAEYGTTKTNFQEDGYSEISSVKPTHNVAAPIGNIGTKGGEIKYDKEPIINSQDKAVISKPIDTKATNTVSDDHGLVTKPKNTYSVKDDGPKSTHTGYGDVKNTSSNSKPTIQRPVKIYKDPSNTGVNTGVKGYDKPKTNEVKKYSYEKPKSYNNAGYTRPSTKNSTYQKPKAVSKPSYTNPKATTKPSYTRPKATTKPSYTRPKATTKPSYTRPNTPTKYTKPRSNNQARPSTSPTRPATKPRNSNSYSKPSSSKRPSTSSRSSSTSRASTPSRSRTTSRASSPSRSSSRGGSSVKSRR